MSAHTRLTLLAAAAILTACATAQENPHYQHSTKYQGSVPSTVYASNAPTTDISTAPAGTVLARVVHTDPNQPLGDVEGSTAYAKSDGSYPASPVLARNTVTESAPLTRNVSAASYGTTAYSAPSYSRVNAACVEAGLQDTAACTPSSLPITTQSASITAPYAGNAQTLYVTSTTTTAISPTEQALPDSYGTPGYEAMKNVEADWDTQNQLAPSWAPVQTTPQAAAAPGVSIPMTEPFASPLPAPSVRQARMPDMMPQSSGSVMLGTQHRIEQGETVYSYARSLCTSVNEIKAINGLDSNFSIRLGDTIRLPASKC